MLFFGVRPEGDLVRRKHRAYAGLARVKVGTKARTRRGPKITMAEPPPRGQSARSIRGGPMQERLQWFAEKVPVYVNVEVERERHLGPRDALLSEAIALLTGEPSTNVMLDPVWRCMPVPIKEGRLLLSDERRCAVLHRGRSSWVQKVLP